MVKVRVGPDSGSAYEPEFEGRAKLRNRVRVRESRAVSNQYLSDFLGGRKKYLLPSTPPPPQYFFLFSEIALGTKVQPLEEY
jgi:hypothetical protein